MASVVSLKVSTEAGKKEALLSLPGHSTVLRLCGAAEQRLGCGSRGAWGIYHICGNQERWLPDHAVLSRIPDLETGELLWRERGRVVEVALLNGTRFTLRIDDSETVAAVLRGIGTKQGLGPEAVKEYGLKFAGKLHAGLTEKSVLTSGWLRPDWTLQQHGVRLSTTLKLSWLKRWYYSDHGGEVPMNEAEYHFVYLECREKFLSDHYELADASQSDVLGCVASLLAVDHSKFDRKKHTAQWFRGKRFAPDSWSGIINASAASRAWKALPSDTTQKVQKKRFVELCRRFNGFGATFFDVQQRPSEGGEPHALTLAVDKNSLRLFLPWSAQQVRERHLNRAALALSPRSPAQSPAKPAHIEASSPPEVSTSPLSSSRKSYFSISRRKKSRPAMADLSPSGAATLSSSSDTPEKSPRGEGRRFSIRGRAPTLDKKQSSGRFQSFRGLKKQNTRNAEDIFQNTTPEKEEGERASSPISLDMNAVDEGVIEKRELVREFLLETVNKWCIGEGGAIYLDIEGQMEPFVVYSPKQADEISQLFEGYCAFRMVDLSGAAQSPLQATSCLRNPSFVRPVEQLMVELGHLLLRSREGDVDEDAMRALVDLSAGVDEYIACANAAGGPVKELCFHAAACMQLDDDLPLVGRALTTCMTFAALVLARDDECPDALGQLLSGVAHGTERTRLLRLVNRCAPGLYFYLGEGKEATATFARDALCDLLAEWEQLSMFDIRSDADEVLDALFECKRAVVNVLSHEGFNTRPNVHRSLADASLKLSSSVRTATVAIGEMLESFSLESSTACAASITELAQVASKTILLQTNKGERQRSLQVISLFASVLDRLVEWVVDASGAPEGALTHRMYGNKSVIGVLLREAVMLLMPSSSSGACHACVENIQLAFNELSMVEPASLAEGVAWPEVASEVANQLRLLKITVKDIHSPNAAVGVLETMSSTTCFIVGPVRRLVAMLPKQAARIAIVSQFQQLGARAVKLLEFIAGCQWGARDPDGFQKVRASLQQQVDVTGSVLRTWDPTATATPSKKAGAFRRRSLSIEGAKAMMKQSRF